MADVTVRMSAENAEVIRAWMEAKRGVSEFSQELDRAGQKGKRAGQGVQDGFGGALVSRITSVVGGLALLDAGINTVTQSWTRFIEVQNKANEAMKSTATASAKLSQVAAGDPEKLERLNAKRDELAEKYNMEPAAAVEAIFNAQSAGLGDRELDTAAKGGIIGDDPAEATRFMGAIKQIYGDKIDPVAAYNVAFQTQADAANLEMKDVTAGLPQLMNPGDVLGIGLEDIAAIFNQTSARHGKAETATRNQRLLSKLSMKPEYAGKGMAGLEKFVNLPEEQWKDIIGEDTEPRAAARALRDKFSEIKDTSKRYKQVAADTGPKDVVNQALEAHFAIPENVATFEEGRKEKAVSIEQKKKFGVPVSERKQAISESELRVEKEEMNFISRAGAGVGSMVAGLIGANDFQTRYLTRMGETMGKLDDKSGGGKILWDTFRPDEKGLFVQDEAKRMKEKMTGQDKAKLINEVTGREQEKPAQEPEPVGYVRPGFPLPPAPPGGWPGNRPQQPAVQGNAGKAVPQQANAGKEAAPPVDMAPVVALLTQIVTNTADKTVKVHDPGALPGRAAPGLKE